MDLLRLVLSRQPLDGLERFPKLLTDKRFTLCRAQVLGYSASKSIWKATARSGEVSKAAIRYVQPHYILARSLFLRDTELALRLYEKVGFIDFWSAIATGIPEIQATALSIAIHSQREEGSPKRVNPDKVLENCNDLSTIPWTPRLETILRSLASEKYQTYDVEIFGFLELPLDDPKTILWSYYTGLCMKVLNFEETMERNERLDLAYLLVVMNLEASSRRQGDKKMIIAKEVIISGYLVPLLHTLRGPDLGLYVIQYALKQASPICLREISRHHPEKLRSFSKVVFRKRLATTEWYRRRVRQVLADEEITMNLHVDILKWYRTVVYESHEKSLGPVLLGLGISEFDKVHGIEKEVLVGRMRLRSLQGVSMQDPLYLYRKGGTGWTSNHHNILISDAYRKGNWHPEMISGTKGEYSAFPTDTILYERIKAYLTGKAETWQ